MSNVAIFLYIKCSRQNVPACGGGFKITLMRNSAVDGSFKRSAMEARPSDKFALQMTIGPSRSYPSCNVRVPFGLSFDTIRQTARGKQRRQRRAAYH